MIQESYRFVTMLELASERFLRKVERQFSNRFYSLVEELQNHWLEWSHANIESTLRDLKDMFVEMKICDLNENHLLFQLLSEFEAVINERVGYARNRAAECACELHRKLEKSFKVRLLSFLMLYLRATW